MKQKYSQTIELPDGVSCTYEHKILKCRGKSGEVDKKIEIPNIILKVEGNKVILESVKGNKNEHKKIMSHVAHLKNIIRGLNEKFIYHLEECHVHFPMTMKIEGDKIVVNNFLGEKTPRFGKILPNVHVEIKGNKITVSSADRAAAGQTAANIEKSTKIVGRDRRVFQDGIFITEKPGREI